MVSAFQLDRRLVLLKLFLSAVPFKHSILKLTLQQQGACPDKGGSACNSAKQDPTLHKLARHTQVTCGAWGMHVALEIGIALGQTSLFRPGRTSVRRSTQGMNLQHLIMRQRRTQWRDETCRVGDGVAFVLRASPSEAEFKVGVFCKGRHYLGTVDAQDRLKGPSRLLPGHGP